MAFLDNSGDIILDAVLTDTGRFRLAKGDGSFRVAKFALADDEINYANYNKNHPSGSAYYDLNILQTPVLEAFTNNIATCKHKLISIPRTNLLYLPVLRIGTHDSQAAANDGSAGATYAVCVDKATEDLFGGNTKGVIAGAVNNKSWQKYIRIDQGLNTTEISQLFTLDADLQETQYIVEIDNRFGQISAPKSVTNIASISYIDDDQVASYYMSLSNNSTFVKVNDGAGKENSDHVISGPRGTMLHFGIKASLELNSSTFLFTKLGNTMAASGILSTASGNLYYIDSNVRVTGGTTGYSISIPVRFIKKV